MRPVVWPALSASKRLRKATLPEKSIGASNSGKRIALKKNFWSRRRRNLPSGSIWGRGWSVIITRGVRAKPVPSRLVNKYRYLAKPDRWHVKPIGMASRRYAVEVELRADVLVLRLICRLRRNLLAIVWQKLTYRI